MKHNEVSFANSLPYQSSKVNASVDFINLRSKLTDLVEYSKTTGFDMTSRDICIAGGSLVDTFLDIEVHDYDVFINIHTANLKTASEYLNDKPKELKLVQQALTATKKNKDFVWLSGLIARKFFADDKNMRVPDQTKEYDESGIMAEGTVEGVSKLVQLCFNVNRPYPLKHFDIECCKMGLTLDGHLFGSGLKDTTVKFTKNYPTIRHTERAVKYLLKGVPAVPKSLLDILKGGVSMSPQTIGQSGASMAIVEWLTGEIEDSMFSVTNPVEVVKYKKFREQLNTIPIAPNQKSMLLDYYLSLPKDMPF